MCMRVCLRSIWYGFGEGDKPNAFPIIVSQPSVAISSPNPTSFHIPRCKKDDYGIVKTFVVESSK